MHFPRRSTLGSLSLLAFAAAAFATGFETAGKVPVARYLSPAQMAGPEWKVAPEAENDGAFNTYLVQSRFGTFEARGRSRVAVRGKEVAALVELEQVSKSEVFTDAVKSSALGSVDTVMQFAQAPVETIKAVPQAAGRWFKKTKFMVQETYSDVKDAKAERDQQKSQPQDEAAKAAQRDQAQAQAKELAKKEALDYLKISGAERRWYAELGVDPYTDNQVLRAVVKSYSRVEGITRFGMKFVGLPGIPGAREMRQVMNLVWQTDPWELRLQNRKRLMAAGLSEETAKAFEDNPYLTLTEQTGLLAAMDRMAGVKGRQHLVARGIDLESKQAGQALFQSTLLLVAHHQGERPLAEILPGSSLPVARSADGRLVSTFAGDALFWTEPMAGAAAEFVGTYEGDAAKIRELWIVGEATDRFKSEMKARGWQVLDRWQVVESPAGK
jgi:hypothetical protein